MIVKDVEIKLDTASLKHKGDSTHFTPSCYIALIFTGFAFATFPTEDSARAVCNKQFFKLRGKDVSSLFLSYAHCCCCRLRSRKLSRDLPSTTELVAWVEVGALCSCLPHTCSVYRVSISSSWRRLQSL